ncbi:hypothetical protein SAICODRAFT_144103 [Saitoella complicata NRRL Y-17804]|uniref:uncharacterized protein n=1 Tax=Saitoella complicata (strain BCRC 22490 / CBS 7301 / JCM 7358 / NBRC 10748 / NRRL Y-17804) TaxID=698492 RepID=UPI000867BAF1|nr:uncharacterized protein SAICODRAFT_144103 [Saitoella complicata NRRL Y-17804]ODQ51780.1 hypothetical protein SAICODRAFT_144103 [Saitoella complicata NRRL Y-17804]
MFVLPCAESAVESHLSRSQNRNEQSRQSAQHQPTPSQRRASAQLHRSIHPEVTPRCSLKDTAVFERIIPVRIHSEAHQTRWILLLYFDRRVRTRRRVRRHDRKKCTRLCTRLRTKRLRLEIGVGSI